ncbi:LysR family transcriptional regulator [Aliiroseovarius crassostreae]|uniref:LysR family transcriptional regulator n=1 Tax=Aliiroseovarius crassostreae TaxID=154981 RepID=UPI002207338B|nr:LysR family transcriptional regulator [Aliiroseovarius crassostreae]UWP88647.1 LysR family transcriptional regulator [Aliiroseovarius crassostreae]
MDWSHLKVVMAIARAGTLTQAAQLLEMDQTTVGRRLNALEAQLGEILFVRSKSGFMATDQGRIVLEHARSVEAMLEQMQDDLREQSENVAGVVRIVSNTWILQRLARRAAKDILNSHPRLELRLSGRLPPVPPHGEATLSLWFDAPPAAMEFSTPFCMLPYAGYRAFDLPAQSLRWVLFRDDDAPGPTMTRQLRKKLGEKVQVPLTATDASILMTAVEDGIGKGVLPECLGDENPRLVRLEEGEGAIQMGRVLHLHRNPDTMESKRVRAVITWLQAAMRRDFGAQLITPGKSATRPE